MRQLAIELLGGGPTLYVAPLIASEFLSDHGKFIARNGGIDAGGAFIPFHAIKEIRFYEPKPALDNLIETLNPIKNNGRPRKQRQRR